jgi:hypothetical protein
VTLLSHWSEEVAVRSYLKIEFRDISQVSKTFVSLTLSIVRKTRTAAVSNNNNKHHQHSNMNATTTPFQRIGLDGSDQHVEMKSPNETTAEHGKTLIQNVSSSSHVLASSSSSSLGGNDGVLLNNNNHHKNETKHSDSNGCHPMPPHSSNNSNPTTTSFSSITTPLGITQENVPSLATSSEASSSVVGNESDQKMKSANKKDRKSLRKGKWTVRGDVVAHFC